MQKRRRTNSALTIMLPSLQTRCASSSKHRETHLALHIISFSDVTTTPRASGNTVTADVNDDVDFSFDVLVLIFFAHKYGAAALPTQEEHKMSKKSYRLITACGPSINKPSIAKDIAPLERITESQRTENAQRNYGGNIHHSVLSQSQTMVRPTLLLLITLTAALLIRSNCFAHPALPIPNARPPKKRFAPDADRGGVTSTCSSSTATSTTAKGKSNPISGTPFRGIARHFASSSGYNEGDSVPPSRVESIVANAKSLSAKMGKRMDLTNPTLRTQYLTAMTAGLAVSLAMVPEAVSFSFVAGVSPLVGLWTTVVLGFFAALFGGRAGICSSASGACSVVVAALCASREYIK